MTETTQAPEGYTPGPWAVEGHYDAFRTVARVRGEPFACINAAVDVGPSHSARWADARLIAAAPQMLEALRSVLDPGVTTADSYALVRAAIAAATGGVTP